MKPWYFRYARVLIYAGAAVAMVAIALIGAWDSPGLGATLIAARQLYGLWALALLLASMLLGPLTAVFPGLPGKSSLMYGRRAVGVSALLMALLHSLCYFYTVFLRDWHELYTPGVLWVVGLLLGIVAMADMLILGLTSRDRAVKRMGGRKWKRVHTTIYIMLPLVLIHSFFVGSDFGFNRAPDVKGEPDTGAGIAFLCVSAAWLVLFILRHRGIWVPGGKVKE